MSTLRLATPSKRRALPTATPEKTTKRWLMRSLPELFSTTRPKPLAIGIRAELAAIRPAEVSHKGLRRALARWCSRPDYLAALAAGGARYGLAGERGEVTPEQRQRARLALVRHRPASRNRASARPAAGAHRRDTKGDSIPRK